MIRGAGVRDGATQMRCPMKTNVAVPAFALCFAGALGAAVPAPVLAQELGRDVGRVRSESLERGETVIDRRRPEVEPLGVRAGAFRILPRVEVGPTYQSNVFATENNEQDDVVWIINPSIAARSDFADDFALNLMAAAEIGRYSDFTSENYTDYRLAADGRFDIDRERAVEGNLFHRGDHEGRGDPDLETGFAEPVEYTRTGGGLGYRQRFNRISVGVRGEAERLDFDDVRRTGGGVDNQDDRDRWEHGASLRVGYQVTEAVEAFVRGTLTRIRHLDDRDDAGFDRDSSGYEVVAGAAVELTGLLTGEAFAGYLSRDFEDARLSDFGGLGFGGRLVWSPTGLTSVTLAASREVDETGFTRNGVRASSYDRTILALGIDHELLRNLLLDARAQYRVDDFNGVDRSDDVYTLRVGARWLTNRHLTVSGGYTREWRNSGIPSFDYTDNLVSLRIVGHL